MTNPFRSCVPFRGDFLSREGARRRSILFAVVLSAAWCMVSAAPAIAGGNVILQCPEKREISVGDDCHAKVPDLTSELIVRCVAYSVDQQPSPDTDAKLGETTITFTVTCLGDNPPEPEMCTATVTFVDSAPPKVSCTDGAVKLDSTGVGKIFPSDYFNPKGSSDNCGGVTIVPQDAILVSCEDVGEVSVVIEAQDDAGNVDSCKALITVYAPDPPEIKAANVDEDGKLHLNVQPGSHCGFAENVVTLDAGSQPTLSGSVGGGLKWSIATPPTKGTASFPNNSTGSSVEVCYTPNRLTASDRFTVRVEDGCGQIDEIVINISTSRDVAPDPTTPNLSQRDGAASIDKVPAEDATIRPSACGVGAGGAAGLSFLAMFACGALRSRHRS